MASSPRPAVYTNTDLQRISNELIDGKFAACANILAGVESIYPWKGKIENGRETLVLFKLSEDPQSAFQEKLRLLHPYEIPVLHSIDFM